MQADGEVGPSREIGFTMRNPVKKKGEDQQLSRSRYREGEGSEVEVMLVDDGGGITHQMRSNGCSINKV